MEGFRGFGVWGFWGVAFQAILARPNPADGAPYPVRFAVANYPVSDMGHPFENVGNSDHTDRLHVYICTARPPNHKHTYVQLAHQITNIHMEVPRGAKNVLLAEIELGRGA